MKSDLFTFKIPYGGDSVEITVTEGESLSVFGENSSGKSEVLHAFATLGRGFVYRGVKGRRTHDDIDRFESEVGVCDGVPKEVLDDTVIHLIEKTAMLYNKKPEEVREIFLLPDFAPDTKVLGVDEEIAERLALLYTLTQGHKVVLIDDLFGLDFDLKERLIPFLIEVKEKGDLTYIIATSDIALAEICENCLIVEDEKVVEYGKSSKVLSTPYHPYSKWLVGVSRRGKSEVNFNKTSRNERPRKKTCRYAYVCPFAGESCMMLQPLWKEYLNTATACHKVESDK